MNVDREYERNMERYTFLKWGQTAFDNFRVVPPGTGICHQVNLEYLAQTVWTDTDQTGATVAYPDTLVGTDSHTTMVNGLAVLGWGVGGIEAEAAMLGQPISMLIPEVVGFKLTGRMLEGTTATDLVLKVVQMLRKKGVVGKFVEFYGDGLDHLPLADRATIANMAPEYGATCGFFPIDDETLRYLRQTGRDEDAHRAGRGLRQGERLVARPGLRPGLYRHAGARHGRGRARHLGPEAAAGPHAADRAAKGFFKVVAEYRGEDEGAAATHGSEGPAPDALVDPRKTAAVEGEDYRLRDGSVVIASITSCTNTSNPYVMIGAGLVARKARALGLTRKPWVKTSLAPGTQVVTDYLEAAGPAGGSRRHRLQPRRLRLHHLHRQFRARFSRSLEGDQRQRPDRGRGPVGQPQLRGPDQPGRARELPRLAAAGRGLCARRRHEHRPHDRAARPRRATATRSTSRTSGPRTPRSPNSSSAP